MQPRHGTAEAMALDLGLQGDAAPVRWGAGADDGLAGRFSGVKKASQAGQAATKAKIAAAGGHRLWLAKRSLDQAKGQLSGWRAGRYDFSLKRHPGKTRAMMVAEWTAKVAAAEANLARLKSTKTGGMSGLGADPLPTPEQQGANASAFWQGAKGRTPVAPPATATAEEKAVYVNAARLAAQGKQTAAGIAQLRDRFAPAPIVGSVGAPQAAAPSKTPLIIAAVTVVGLLMWLGGKD